MTRAANFRSCPAAIALACLLLAGGNVLADSVTQIYVGTLSNPLTAFGSNAANNPGLVARGNKYVIRTTFDTDDLFAVSAGSRTLQTRDFHAISLDDAPGGTNTFELFLPSEGFGGVLTQTGQDHFNLGFAPTAEVHFVSACTSAATCGSAFRGFEFESNFIRNNSPAVPAAGGDLVFELRDPDTNLSGTTTTNHVVNILDGNLNGLMFNGGTTDIRSESSAPAGGQNNPGVFFGAAVPIIAEAGATPLVYSAGQLSVTTDAGTELVTETAAAIIPGELRAAPSAFDEQPRQADNDLGAGRSDGEDFLTYSWTAGGAAIAGSEDGTRLNRIVETGSPGGRQFANDGTRTVDDVNITRSLAGSGLANTLDTATFDVTVTESITGLSDTDTVAVSYTNDGPAATAGGGIVFDSTNIATGVEATGTADDPDLAANAEVAGFETLSAQFSTTAGAVGVLQNLGSPTSGPIPVNQNVTLLDAFNAGLTMTTAAAQIDLTITDFAGESASASQAITYLNTLPVLTSAGHTTTASNGIIFNADYDDADLAANAFLGVMDFEMLFVEILIDGVDQSGIFGDLIGTGGTSQHFSNAALLGLFGDGIHSFALNVRDKTMLADGVAALTLGFDFDVQPIPLPAAWLLFGPALGLCGLVRRRHPVDGRPNH